MPHPSSDQQSCETFAFQNGGQPLSRVEVKAAKDTGKHNSRGKGSADICKREVAAYGSCRFVGAVLEVLEVPEGKFVCYSSQDPDPGKACFNPTNGLLKRFGLVQGIGMAAVT